MPILEIVREGGQQFRTEIRGDRMVIGRSRTCELTIRDSSVSKTHAAIERRPDGTYFVSDLGSTNGIRVNGRQVPGEVLRDGTVFHVGRFTITFRAGGASGSPAPGSGSGSKAAEPAAPVVIVGTEDDAGEGPTEEEGPAKPPAEPAAVPTAATSTASGAAAGSGPGAAPAVAAEAVPAPAQPVPAPAAAQPGAPAPVPSPASPPPAAPPAPVPAAAPAPPRPVQLKTSLPCTEITPGPEAAPPAPPPAPPSTPAKPSTAPPKPAATTRRPPSGAHTAPPPSSPRPKGNPPRPPRPPDRRGGRSTPGRLLFFGLVGGVVVTGAIAVLAMGVRGTKAIPPATRPATPAPSGAAPASPVAPKPTAGTPAPTLPPAPRPTVAPGPAPAPADPKAAPPVPPPEAYHTLRLKSGQVLKGRIVRRTAAAIDFESADPASAAGTPAKTASYPIEDVAKIDDEWIDPDWKSVFDERLLALRDSRSTASYLELAQWAEAHHLAAQRDRAYRAALSVEPDNAAAHSALGEVRVDGRWLSKDEAQARGGPDASPKLPPGTDPRRVMRRYAMDLLGRSPSDEEARDAVALAPEELVDKLVHSPEHFEVWTEEQLAWLHLADSPRPAPDLLAALAKHLAGGEIGACEALRTLVLSPAFAEKHPGDEAFAAAALELLLGVHPAERKDLLEPARKMAEGGPAELLGQKGASRPDLVNILLAQKEAAELLLRRTFVARVGREPLPGALVPAVDRLMKEPAQLAAIEKGWLLSKEYLDTLAQPRPKSDPLFLRALFMDVLGRRPTEAEFRGMRGALATLADSRPMRAVLARILVASDKVPVPDKDGLDFAPWLAAQYGKYLGRTPTEEEASLFKDVLSGKGATTRTLLTAILTSPEYQLY